MPRQFVEGLHADHHNERETSDDDRGETCIYERQEIRPPSSKFGGRVARAPVSGPTRPSRKVH
jgi:hypothetical protein